MGEGKGQGRGNVGEIFWPDILRVELPFCQWRLGRETEAPSLGAALAWNATSLQQSWGQETCWEPAPPGAIPQLGPARAALWSWTRSCRVELLFTGLWEEEGGSRAQVPQTPTLLTKI